MAKANRPPQRSQGSQGSRRPATGATQSANSANTVKAKSPAASGATSGAGSSTRLAAMRARTAQPQRYRGRYIQQPWWRRNLAVLLTVTGVVVLIAAFIIAAQLQNKATSVGIGDAVPASVLSELTNVSPSVSAKVGDGGVQNVFEATPKNTAVLTANGKPEVVYIGADYCPYCAATRWSTVVALSRFGSFKGLTLMKSSNSDIYASTNTFSFQNATYTSKYITFNATETEDRNQNPMATPPADAMSSFSTYNVAPYTNQAGGIPFMSYGNQYVTTSGLFVPTMLQNLTWQQIAAQLNNPNSDVTKAIVGGANYQTAAICKITNNQPSSVCSTAVIQQLEATLPAAK
ncbi:MAG TPA: DUF929 family protein [Ktedonobacterales bacterium]